VISEEGVVDGERHIRSEEPSFAPDHSAERERIQGDSEGSANQEHVEAEDCAKWPRRLAEDRDEDGRRPSTPRRAEEGLLER
jgi:hypothetical protein